MYKRGGDFGEARTQRTDFERVVGGDGDVALSTLRFAGESEVAAGLAGDFITVLAERASHSPPSQAAVSSRDDRKFDEVKTDHARAAGLVELATNGVSRGGPQFFDHSRPLEDGIGEGKVETMATNRELSRVCSCFLESASEPDFCGQFTDNRGRFGRLAWAVIDTKESTWNLQREPVNRSSSGEKRAWWRRRRLVVTSRRPRTVRPAEAPSKRTELPAALHPWREPRVPPD